MLKIKSIVEGPDFLGVCKRLDTDSTGSIDQDQLLRGLKLYEPTITFTDYQKRQIVKIADRNLDNTIFYQEFINFVKKIHIKPESHANETKLQNGVATGYRPLTADAFSLPETSEPNDDLGKAVYKLREYCSSKSSFTIFLIY